ncbi:MAG TPA: hypothetical protein VJC39_01200 [Candidatus Nanoarchaeia archaeon]|nr:hypothetical protein [Candidatus Nanoarchaeia archaeon]
MTNVQNPHEPDDQWERPEEENIYRPRGSSRGNAASGTLSPENQKFLGLKDQSGIEDLQKSILLNYLTSQKITKGGVDYWKTDADPKEISSLIVDELTFHLHRRNPPPGMTPELYEQLKNVTDTTSGKSYLDIITETKTGVNKPSLEQFLRTNGTDLGAVSQLAGRVGGQYLQREVVGSLRKEFGTDLSKYKSGIKNLQQVHGVAQELTDETLSVTGLDEIVQAYVQAVFEANEKIKRK